jgi:hypothetical protein
MTIAKYEFLDPVESIIVPFSPNPVSRARTAVAAGDPHSESALRFHIRIVRSSLQLASNRLQVCEPMIGGEILTPKMEPS